VILGSPKLSKARENAVASIKAGAEQYAANVLPIIREAQKGWRDHVASRSRSGYRKDLNRMLAKPYS
jgi:hypothetical protein